VLQGVSEKILFATPIPKSRQSGNANRYSHGSHAKRSPMAVRDYHAYFRAGLTLKRLAESPSGSIRIARQQQNRFLVAHWSYVRAIDARVGAGEAESVTHN
jgi:hypothetical protein